MRNNVYIQLKKILNLKTSEKERHVAMMGISREVLLFFLQELLYSLNNTMFNRFFYLIMHVVASIWEAKQIISQHCVNSIDFFLTHCMSLLNEKIFNCTSGNFEVWQFNYY